MRSCLLAFSGQRENVVGCGVCFCGLPHSTDEIQSEESIRPGEEFKARSVGQIAVPLYGSQDLKRARCVEIVVGSTSSERRKERGLHRLEEEQWDSRDDLAIEEDPWRLLAEFVTDDGERNRPDIEKECLRDRGGKQQAECRGELVER